MPSVAALVRAASFARVHVVLLLRRRVGARPVVRLQGAQRHETQPAASAFEGLRFGEVKKAHGGALFGRTERFYPTDQSMNGRPWPSTSFLPCRSWMPSTMPQMTETTDSQPQETTVIASCAMPMPMRPW